jgi:hypothetical protein
MRAGSTVPHEPCRIRGSNFPSAYMEKCSATLPSWQPVGASLGFNKIQQTSAAGVMQPPSVKGAVPTRQLKNSNRCGCG